jgi:hypothetical protein
MTRSLALALLLVLALVRSALAQDDALAEARTHFTQGVQLIDQGRWQEAVTELEAARRLHPTAPVLYNLGIAQRGIGHPRAAIDAFREFLDMLGTDAPAARVTEVNGYVEELRAQLAEVRLALAPPTARVLVDDVAETPEDGLVRLDPGAHRIRVEADGYEPAFRDVTLERGGRAELSITLEAVVTDGHLLVESVTPGAIATLDGTVVGALPYDARLPAGDHELVVRAPGHVELHRTVSVSVGADVRVAADLPAESEQLLTSPWLWIGVGTVVVAGAVIGVLAATGTFDTIESPFVGDLGVVTGALVVRP